jgi:hypothetical protein
MSVKNKVSDAHSYRHFWSGRSSDVKLAVEYYINSTQKVSMVDAAKKYDVSAHSIGRNVRLLEDQGFLGIVDKKWVWMRDVCEFMSLASANIGETMRFIAFVNLNYNSFIQCEINACDIKKAAAEIRRKYSNHLGFEIKVQD